MNVNHANWIARHPPGTLFRRPDKKSVIYADGSILPVDRFAVLLGWTPDFSNINVLEAIFMVDGKIEHVSYLDAVFQYRALDVG